MARLPSSQDVPTVSPRVMTDPGVRIPQGAFDSTGRALAELVPGVEKYAAVAAEQEARQDAIERSRNKKDGNEKMREMLLDFDAKGDLSDKNHLAAFSSSISELRQKILNEHQGSSASKDRLAISLLDIQAEWEGRAAALSTSIGRAHADSVFNKSVDSIVDKAAQNPTMENIQQIYREELPRLAEDVVDIFNPIEQEQRIGIARDRIALGAIDKLMKFGNVETAQALLDSGLEADLLPDSRRDVRRRIETFTFERDATLRRLATAEGIVGPLSREERKQILGISPSGSTLKTKEVLNLETGRLQFATEEQIAANPNLVPKDASKPEKITSAQRLAAGFALRTEQAHEVIDKLGSAFTGVSSRAAEFLPQVLKGADRQQFEQATRNFTNAILRRESGAAISPSEFTSAEQQYFPRPGDSAAVVEQKRMNRVVVTEALRLEAGEAFTELKASVPSSTVLVRGKPVLVGTIVVNDKGQRGRVEQDGSITILKGAK